MDEILQAESSLIAREVRLVIKLRTGETVLPQYQLVRRERAYPTRVNDGFGVLDLAQFAGNNWLSLQHDFYLGQGMKPENGIYQAAVHWLYTDPNSDRPAEMRLVCNSPAVPSYPKRFTSIRRIKRRSEMFGKRQREITEVYVAGPTIADHLACRIILSCDPAVSATMDQFECETFDVHLIAGSLPEITPNNSGTLSPPEPKPPHGEPGVQPDWASGPIPFTQQVTQKTRAVISRQDEPDREESVFTITIEDGGLTGQVNYYYALFNDQNEIVARKAVMTFSSFGHSAQIYQMLPAFYHTYDEPDPERRGLGRLRAFLDIFGHTLDQIHGSAEGLRGRQDVLQVRADILLHLARWIGWNLDLTQNEISQRNEIRFAPEIYRRTGTLPNLATLVNRITHWDCRIKEFAHNVCLSNAPETIHFWDLWECFYKEKGGMSEPVPLTRTEQFDGGAAYGVDLKSEWLFWHSNRNGSWQIWAKNLTNPDLPAAPIRIIQKDAPGSSLLNPASPVIISTESAVWLFCEAGPAGKREIWAARQINEDSGDPEPVRSANPVFLAENLSNHPADDCHPAAVKLSDEKILVFWQSNRRGAWDIWARIYLRNAWEPARRISKNPFGAEAPAAVKDSHDMVWLFYSGRDQAFYRQLYCQTSPDGLAWSDPQPVTEGPGDESPAAVNYKGKIRLFWQARDEKGHWQVYWKTRQGSQWTERSQITNHPAADKEPGATVDQQGRLRLAWRSQRRGYPDTKEEPRQGGYPYLSCTIDTQNSEMLSALRDPTALENHVHYTFDTADPPQGWCLRGGQGVQRQTGGGQGFAGWCARQTVGIYLVPDTPDAPPNQPGPELIKSLIQGFLPIQVKVIFIIEPVAVHE